MEIRFLLPLLLRKAIQLRPSPPDKLAAQEATARALVAEIEVRLPTKLRCLLHSPPSSDNYTEPLGGLASCAIGVRVL